MRRVEFDARAAGRFQPELQAARPRSWSAYAQALCWALGFLVILAHTAERSGCFPRGGGKFLRDVRVASYREIQSRESSEMNPIRGVVVAGFAVTSGSFGAELLVPTKQHPTIQSAIDLASDGDLIRIAPGTYTESCIVQGKSLSFVGAGAGTTTWRAPLNERCLWMPFLDSKSIVVADIHFTGFSMPYNAAAVDLESTGAHRVSRCRFTECGYFPLEVFGGGSIVEDCQFVGNTGNGVSMTIPQGQLGLEQQILRCSFIDNRNIFGIGSSAITIYNTQLRVEQCTFGGNNYPSGNGVAIEVNSGSLIIVGSTFCNSPGASAITGGWTDGGGNNFATTACVAPCPADLVPDHTVNGADMAIVLNFWGTNGSQFPGVDINADGLVDGSDLAAVLNAWGPCPQ